MYKTLIKVLTRTFVNDGEILNEESLTIHKVCRMSNAHVSRPNLLNPFTATTHTYLGCWFTSLSRNAMFLSMSVEIIPVGGGYRTVKFDLVREKGDVDVYHIKTEDKRVNLEMPLPDFEWSSTIVVADCQMLGDMKYKTYNCYYEVDKDYLAQRISLTVSSELCEAFSANHCPKTISIIQESYYRENFPHNSPAHYINAKGHRGIFAPNPPVEPKKPGVRVIVEDGKPPVDALEGITNYINTDVPETTRAYVESYFQVKTTEGTLRLQPLGDLTAFELFNIGELKEWFKLNQHQIPPQMMEDRIKMFGLERHFTEV